MAKAKGDSSPKRIKIKVSRPGVHAKTKTSRSKRSKHYKKAYRGQGK
jgi:hypothetical protein